MANDKTKTRTIARIVSMVLHPYVVPVLVVLMLAISFISDDWIKWAIIALLLAYLLPLLYIQARVTLVARTAGSQVTHRSLFRILGGHARHQRFREFR